MSATHRTEDLPTTNDEAIEAWDGPLYDRFVQFRHVIIDGLGPHGEAALQRFPPQPGWNVIDIGCGFGDTARQIAGLVGPGGRAIGVDAAPRFIETATREAAEEGVGNVEFAVRDVQSDDLGGPYDMAYSRMGTMFFARPGAAMGNIHRALKPGAQLVMVVWRKREDNGWLYRGQQIVESIVQRPEEYDEPTCGPGPFSMNNADTVTDLLTYAGFSDISLLRCDLPILIGTDVDEAIDIIMSIGPAGEILRLQGERAAHLHGDVRKALEEGLQDFRTPDGLRGGASTWIVSATA